jgi:hypothetical protein
LSVVCIENILLQPIPDSHRHPVTCRIITIDDNVDQTFSTNGHSDQTVIGQNKLDDWVIRERQVILRAVFGPYKMSRNNSDNHLKHLE